MTSVDRTLAIAAATPTPSAPSPELVLEKKRGWDCDRYDHRDRERQRTPGGQV